MSESLYQKEARLLREYQTALDRQENYHAKQLYAELVQVRKELAKFRK